MYEEALVIVDGSKITDCFNKAVELVEAFIEAKLNILQFIEDNK